MSGKATFVALLVIAALLLPSRAAIAQSRPPEGAITLGAAIEQAVAANPHLAAARLKRPVDVAGVDVARQLPNPELSYEFNRDTPKHSFSVLIPIEIGGKRSNRIDLARAVAKSGDAAIAQEEFVLKNEVRRVYFALAAAQERVTAAADLRSLSLRARDAAQARLALGDAPRLELLQAELELAAADNDLTTATAAVAASRAALNTLLGRAPATPVAASDALTTRALPGADDALARANGASAELATIDAAIAEQSMRRALAVATTRPEITAGAGITSGIPDEFSTGWRASLGVTVPLFTRKAGVVVEDRELARLRAERVAVLADITGHVGEARVRALAAEQQLDRFEKDILPRALEVERMAEDSYKSGQSNLAALLQTLHSSREMRFRALDAALDYQLALADVERAMGVVIK